MLRLHGQYCFKKPNPWWCEVLVVFVTGRFNKGRDLDRGVGEKTVAVRGLGKKPYLESYLTLGRDLGVL